MDVVRAHMLGSSGDGAPTVSDVPCEGLRLFPAAGGVADGRELDVCIDGELYALPRAGWALEVRPLPGPDPFAIWT